MTNDDEAAVGPANDETAVIAASDAVTELRQSQDALAWSVEEPEAVALLRAPGPLAHGLLILVLLAAITVASYVIAKNAMRTAPAPERLRPGRRVGARWWRVTPDDTVAQASLPVVDRPARARPR